MLAKNITSTKLPMNSRLNGFNFETEIVEEIKGIGLENVILISLV